MLHGVFRFFMLVCVFIVLLIKLHWNPWVPVECVGTHGLFHEYVPIEPVSAHELFGYPWISWVPFESMGTHGFHEYPCNLLWVPRDILATHGFHGYSWIP